MKKPRILAVDDISDNLVVLCAILQELNVTVDTAYSGQEALGKVQDNLYALILMDISMPVMSGFECTSIIRKNPTTQLIPVIFITAFGKSKRYVDEGYNLGAVDYLVKPIQEDILISKVKVFLDLYQQRQTIESNLKEIEEVKKRNEQLLNFMAEGVLGLDTSSTITFANIAACTLLTQQREYLIGRNIKDVVDPFSETENWHQSEFVSTFADKQCRHNDDAVFWRNQQDTFPVEYTQASIVENDQLVGGVIAFQDITERKEAEKVLVNLSRYDSLTGLANRGYYWDFLTTQLASMQRSDDQLQILFIDLDNFKNINDTIGHDAGDRLLIQAAERLRRCTRESDLVARMGGDEFSIILQNTHGNRAGATVAKKILQEFQQPFLLYGRELYVGCSIGISVYPENGRDATLLTKAADTAMYHAKQSGRNNYKYFNRQMQKRIQSDMEMCTELRNALEKNQFELYYQPQIEAQTHKIIGLEALIRWHHPQKGMVPPALFIPIAEQSGLIHEIGDWCFNNAVEQIKRWKSDLEQDVRVTVAINMSAKQLKSDGFSERILQIIDQHQVPANCIELELTETAIMENEAQSINTLQAIHDRGIRISVDDFGTGYSSLSYLKNLPIDTLKIDGAFVKDIGKDRSDEAIVNSIVQLAHNLELTVVAECVETATQLEYLESINCDYVQGYFFSKPADVDTISHLLSKQKSA